MKLENGIIINQYEIISPIGKGGMGEVFLAQDTKLERRVALKILPSEFAEDADRMSRFVREAKSASALNHPNIITIYEIGESNGTHFIATEFIDGKTLTEYAKANRLEYKAILEIAVQVASALQTAHSAGIVHRDIKPDNVMIRADGLAKILDFGIAKLSAPTVTGEEDATAIKSQTQAGMIIGTPQFMSPEQARGQQVDHQTDIFSFGVVFYEMLSGASPFAGETVSDVIAAVLTKEPPRLTNVPPELAAILDKTLLKDKRNRYQSAKDLLRDLKEVKEELAINSRLNRVSSPDAEEPQTQILQTPTTAEKSTGSTTGSEDGFWIAVLPFKYRGGRADLEDLAEGLSEEIITGLSRFSYLRVIGLGSTLHYKNDADDARAIGDELGARYVLEGSLRQVGATMRLAAHLVDTSNGIQLWSENYQRAFSAEALFDLQDELVPRIVSTVADWYGVLAQSMSEFVRLKSPEKLSPYEALLRSFGYTARLTAEDHLETRDSLEQSVNSAPGNADCWAMLSTIYADEYKFGYNLKPDPLSRTLAAALRAVEVAPSNSFANYALAQARFFRKEFDAFRSGAERAIQLNPMNGSIAAYMGQLIYHTGDRQRGYELSEKARAMNPQHPGWYWIVPFHQAYDTHDYRLALSYVLKVNMPGLFIYHMHLTAAYGQLGERELAAQAARDLLTIAPGFELFVRDFCEKFEDHETVEHMIEGLRKAGLNIADAPNKKEPEIQILHAQTTAETENQNSIAVLPFANMSADEDNEYFCDGLAEELLNALAKIEDLRVAARTSAFSFKGKNANASEIGEKLNVKTVLEGSVRRSGNRLRITVQLINAADGYHLWSERYDREMRDIFDVQDEITLAVVDRLKLKLFGDEKAELLKRGTENTDAYQLYLKGRFFSNKFTVEGIEKAIELYEQAIAIDSEYAMAYVGVSDAYFFLGIPDATTGILSPQESLPKALAAAEKALEIDSSLGDAWAALAHVKEKSFDVQGAKEAYKKSFESSVNDPNWHFYYGIFLSTLGEHEKAIAEIRRGQELDPLSAPCAACMGYVLHNARRYKDAIRELKKALKLAPVFPLTHQLLGMSYVQEGDYGQAIKAFQTACDYSHRSIVSLASLAHAYAVSGNRNEAEKLLGELLDLSERRYVSPYSIAKIYVGLNEKEKAFEFLERAWSEKNIEMVFINVEPVFDSLRGEARFQNLIRRIGLPANETKQTDESLEAQTVMLSSGELKSEQPNHLEAQNASAELNSEQTANPKSAHPNPKSKWWLIGLLGLILIVSGFFTYRYFTPVNKQIESIAVMPFVNESGNQDVEYLSDGMTETLINSLSQLPNLSVKARSSVFRYKGKETNPQTIAKELNVQAILNGRVVQRGDGLTLSLELIDAQTENVIWSESYNRKQTDLVLLQSEIARDVSGKLKTKLSGADAQKVTKNYTTDAEANKLYLQGRFYANKRTTKDAQKAIEYFERAVALDPNYALAYAGLADAYTFLTFYGVTPPNEAFPKAREAASKAMALDYTLAEPNSTLAVVSYFENHDFAEFERLMKRAVELNPNDMDSHRRNGLRLLWLGKFDEARAEFNRALEIEPMSVVANTNYAMIYFYEGKIDESEALVKKAVELDERFWFSHFYLSQIYRLKGNYAMAAEELAKVQELRDDPEAARLMRESFARGGWQGFLRAVGGDKRARGVLSPYIIATLYAETGEKDKAFAALNETFEKADQFIGFLKIDPFMNPLRGDPRFKELSKRAGFPE